MAVYQILSDNNPVLREKAKPITKVNDAAIRLLNNLRDTLRETPKGVGLAAPQIGISKRAFVVEIPDEELYYEMINPELLETEGSEDAWEGCLSVTEIEGLVPRACKLVVRYIDRESREQELSAEGFLARVIQHEYDHLNGVLFKDKAVSFRSPDSQGDENGEDEDGLDADAGVETCADDDPNAGNEV